MTQTKNKQKNIISSLGQYIKKIAGVTEHVERTPGFPQYTESDSSIGSFRFNRKIINYIVIETGGNKFINFRLNTEFKKKELKKEYQDRKALLEKINERNSNTIGIKYFIAKEDEEITTISANSEHIIDKSINHYKFVDLAITILSTSFILLGVNKQEE